MQASDGALTGAAVEAGLACVQRHDGAHDGEAESGALSVPCPRRIGLIEAVKYMWQVLRGNTRSLIAHLNLHATGSKLAYRDTHVATRRRVANSIGEQII